MLLSALLRDVPDAQVVGPDIEIESIEYSSGKVREGSLFFAVPSVGGPPTSGGYRYIRDAVRSGARAVMTQEPVEIEGATLVLVPRVREAMADAAATYYGYPSRDMKIFAVTGTDGKTTTTYLLEGILAHSGLTTGMTGTVETKIANERVYNAERMTTPESVDVQRLLRRMADAGVTHVAMEASSHALALDRLRGCTFAATALTNITGDHVEFHGSFDAYVRTKRRLFAELAPHAPAVLNHDDPHFQCLADAVEGQVYGYGFEPGGTYQAVVTTTTPTSSTFELRSNTESLGPFTVPLPGKFNVLNAAAACLLAMAAGLDVRDIAAGLKGATRPPGRLQEIAEDAPFRVVVDYAHTPNAFRSVLTSLREQTPGRLIAVFGATGNRDRAKRPVLGRIAWELTDFFVITNEDPFGEDVDDIISEVASGAPRGEEGSRYVIERDRMKAIRLALERAQSEDTVVITGKGHERSIVANGRREPWSDAHAARAVLESLQ